MPADPACGNARHWSRESPDHASAPAGPAGWSVPGHRRDKDGLHCRDNSHQQHIQTLVSKPDAIDFIHASVNDIWVRDTVFLSVEQEGAITHLNFLFNGWGEKYTIFFIPLINLALVGFMASVRKNPFSYLNLPIKLSNNNLEERMKLGRQLLDLVSICIKQTLFFCNNFDFYIVLYC